MYCPNCGKQNNEEAKFCAYCGANITTGETKDESNPKKRIKNGISNIINSETPQKAKKSWEKFSIFEKMIAIGGIAVLVSFFLPWASTQYSSKNITGVSTAQDVSGWLYLFPILGILSVVLVFLQSRSNKNDKTLGCRWQIMIGTFFTVIGLLGILAGNDIFSLLGGGVSFGWWLMFLGGFVILVGALKLQKSLLSS